MADALEIVSRDEIYAATGVQFMPINTIYQLFAADPAVAVAARPGQALRDDSRSLQLLAHRRGVLRVHRRLDNAADQSAHADMGDRRDGAPEAAALAWPRRLWKPESIIGPIQAAVAAGAALAGTPVIASASHDTASAVAAITARDGVAFISSGTWSLVGIEIDEPVLTPRAMQLNFSNEGGVEGTTRLLKNVMGLWLLQGCRRSWAAAATASSPMAS